MQTPNCCLTRLFISCLASMVIYFLLCNIAMPLTPPPLRNFALLACFTCSLEECFIRDAFPGLVPLAGIGVPVVRVTGRLTAKGNGTIFCFRVKEKKHF